MNRWEVRGTRVCWQAFSGARRRLLCSSALIAIGAAASPALAQNVTVNAGETRTGTNTNSAVALGQPNSTLTNNGTITVNSNDAGPPTISIGGDNTTITNNGLISRSGTGGDRAIFSSNPLTINNNAGGRIVNTSTAEGADDDAAGIFVQGVDATSTVNNRGEISTTGTGIVFYGGDNSGVGGTLNNYAGGTISGRRGFFSYWAGTVDNAGTISGSDVGVEILDLATVTNRAGGVISASAGTALSTYYYGTIDNSGRIQGADNAIYFTTEGGKITNRAGASLIGARAIASGNAVILDNYGTITSNGTATLDGIKLDGGGRSPTIPAARSAAM